MRKKIFILFFTLICASFFPASAPAASSIGDYLCNLGVSFYQVGAYDDALDEFNRALKIDPQNSTAQKYISEIFTQGRVKVRPAVSTTAATQKGDLKNAERDAAINDTFQQLGQRHRLAMQQNEEGEAIEVAGVRIRGDAQVSLGLASGDDVIWKRANADLNEENYRILSDANFNRRSNTYDPRIFDRLKVNFDKDSQEGLGFHGNISVDPWSFTGKSEKINLIGSGGLDVVQIQPKYWSNTGYTVNETFRTLERGDSFSFPEVKVKDGKIPAFSIASLNSNIFNIPEIKIKREFMPLRELWFDYQTEGVKFHLFPMGFENQALTSDDPLRLSNNHIWWQESPWIRKWLAGTLNSALSVRDFTPGKLDNSLAYLVRDSDGTRLTALRGLSLDYSTQENFSFSSTFATPKDPWQDYASFDNLMNATRFKLQLADNLRLGSVYTLRYGVDEGYHRDSYNYVWGFDLGYEPITGLKFSGEGATSRSKSDLTFPDYETKRRGNAFYLSCLARYPRQSTIDLENGYEQIKAEEGEKLFVKLRLFGTHMDKAFDSTLSTYHETRDDTFWSRHIQFRKPFSYHYSGLYGPTLSWDDIAPYRIGNGVDIGRNVGGLRLEGSWNNCLENLLDVRNVHSVEGKLIENVLRDEATYRVTKKFTAKFLGIYHKLPKTKEGTDPFIIDSSTGDFVSNADIVDGMNPTIKTGSLGLEYAFTDWISINGVWERTNDYTLAYDNFPRGNLTSSAYSTSTQYGRIYRSLNSYLYSQSLFPLPPYQFYNIWKSGLRFSPWEKFEFYLDYTRNEYKSAGQIDDNINHVGFEAAYTPWKKFGIYLRYTYARWNDLTRMTKGYDKIYLGHHNFFSELRFMPGVDDELVLQYGESGRSNVYTQYTDPFNVGLPVLDTQHIVRMYYRRKF